MTTPAKKKSPKTSQPSRPSKPAQALPGVTRGDRRQLKREVRRALGPLRAIENEYLKTLVDPENHRDIRYPDDFLGSTAMVGGLVVYDSYYFPADSTLTPSAEDAGTLYTVVSPTMVHPVLEYKMEQILTNAGLSCLATEQTDEFGAFPLTVDAPSPADESMQMQIRTDGSDINMRMAWQWSDQDFSMPPFAFHLADGTVCYGTPFSDVHAATVVNVNFQVLFSQLLGPGTIVTFKCINAAGTTVSANINLAASTNTVSQSVNIYPLLTILANGQVSAGLPGIAFRMNVVSPAGNTQRYVGIVSMTAIVNTATPRAGANFWTNRFVTKDLPNASTYEETVDKFRTVSMSNWIEYEGSDLQNGGQLASLYYGGGQSPMANGLWDYDTISEVPKSYQGALKLGSYTWWKPTGPEDMLFRRLNGNNRWIHPFIVHSARVATPTQTNSLRLKLAVNYEVLSTAQFFSYDYGPSRPELISHANAMLHDFPSSMENPLHWAAIKDVLSKAGKAVSNVASWAAENKGWLIPAATAVGALL